MGSSSLPTSTSRGRSLTCLFAFPKHRPGILGPCWVRDGLGVGLLEPLGKLLKLVRKQVPVAVQRHRRRGMAELCLHRLDTGAWAMSRLAQGVAKVMEPQPMGSPTLAAAGLKTPATNFCSRSGPPCGAVNTRWRWRR
jgi:hypothetical protein